jgi:hypothetical protein
MGLVFFSRPLRGGPWLILGTPPPLFPLVKMNAEMGIKACCTMRIIVWHVNLTWEKKRRGGLVYIIVWLVGLFVCWFVIIIIITILK